MSDDEDDMPTDFSMDQAGSDAHDMMGFGLPTESERSLMERVRQELKIELKQVNQLSAIFFENVISYICKSYM